MKDQLINRPKGTDGKAILGSDNTTALNQLEKVALNDLDKDKIGDLAECLFVLNNKKYGPIPGAYMVMCTKPGKEWCVAQLNADRAKPFILYEDKVAIHCRAGLGRTGVLICIWLIIKLKFKPAEAIAYIRIMRPGSIMGSQGFFLESIEYFKRFIW